MTGRFQGYPHDRHAYESSNPGAPRNMDEYGPGPGLPAASSAAAVAQLHGHKIESDWESEPVSFFFYVRQPICALLMHRSNVGLAL